MTSIIKLHCLSGAMDESPPCYVLQVDEFKFLLDCGWDESFDIGIIKELKRHVNSIDAVLISHPDPLHLGALPYAVGKLGLSCPIYATLPVYKMGQMFMYDLFQAHHNMTEFDLFSLDDVDAAFDRITQLKYNQSINMKGKGLGIKITPMAAGHMIGGTVWRISKEGEEDIVYAVDFNHKKERHLNACELERVTRPALLLTDALNSDYVQPRRRTRDERLMTTILSTLRGGGCVLVCTDTAGRVLELAHMLDQLWRNRDSGLVAYSLLMLSNVSYNVIEFAKSQIEWMSDKLTRAFEGARSNPFALRHVQLAHSLHEVTRTPGPKVVLASHPDLESGFARDLFLLWCQQPQNSIVLTTRTGPGTLARKLLDGEREMEVLVKRRVRLEGAELEEWLRTRRPRIRADPAPLSSDSDSDEELEMRVLTGRHDIPVKTLSNSTTHYFKVNKRHHAMYPFFEERTRSDDYGEIIKAEDYRLAEPMETENEVQPVQVKTEPEPEEWVEAATKCVVVTRQISIKASVVWVELEGRTDGESLLRLVSTIKPRTLVALRGGEKQSKHLAKYCDELSIKAVTPNTGDVLDLTPNTQIFQVKLTDALMSKLSWKKTPRAELAWLCARISAKPLEKINDAQPADDTANEEILSLEPAQDDGSIEPHTAAFINELKLSELKQALARNGLSSEFSGGALSVCNGTIAIRREGSHVTLEGVLSEEYYKVRELLYDQFAIV